MRPTVSVSFGASCETESLQTTNSGDSLRSVRTHWTSIAPALKIAIELDGSGHSYRLHEQLDRVREKFLIKRELTVLRFWNHQVREELESVVEAIWLALEERNAANPSPSSSPFAKGRGETRPSTSKGESND